MALSNRINMRGGGGVAPQQRILYEEGSWGVGYDNPGGYTYQGLSTSGANLLPTSVSLNGSNSTVACIGTTNKIDLTNVNLVKIRATRSGTGVTSLVARETKVLSQTTAGASIAITNASEYTEFALDVSQLTGEFYIVITMTTSTPQNLTFNKLWLE